MNSMQMSSKLLVYTAFLLVAFSPCAVAQASLAPDKWKQVTACQFSFVLPAESREIKKQPVDSCLAAFEYKDIHISLDHGLYSAPLSKQDWMKDYQNVPITLNGRHARLITYEDVQHSQEVVHVTEIHVKTSKVAGWGDVSLLMTISTNPSVDLQIVKRIYESLKFLTK